MMKLRSLFFACTLTLLAPLCPAQSQPLTPTSTSAPTAQPTARPITSAVERREFLENARKSYYILSAHGLTGFTSRVQPDFETFYKAIKADSTAQTQLLPILQKMTFQVVVGPDGDATVNHQIDAMPTDKNLAARVSTAIDGTEQVIAGFLQSWAPFAVNSPFNGMTDSDKIDNLGSVYRLTHQDTNGSVVMLIRPDFAVEEVNVTSAIFKGTMHLTWEPTPQGFRLSKYMVTYSTVDAKSQKMSVEIQYQNVEGFQLPSSVNAKIPVPSSATGAPPGAATFPFTFVTPQVEKR